MTPQEVQKPNVKDYDLQPYGYIYALQTYVEFLENKISAKGAKTKDNIYLNRLKEQYKEHKKAQKIFHGVEQIKYKIRYDAMRLFCLDTQLVSFNDIEAMEFEVNSSF